MLTGADAARRTSATVSVAQALAADATRPTSPGDPVAFSRVVWVPTVQARLAEAQPLEATVIAVVGLRAGGDATSAGASLTVLVASLAVAVEVALSPVTARAREVGTT